MGVESESELVGVEMIGWKRGRLAGLMGMVVCENGLYTSQVEVVNLCNE